MKSYFFLWAFSLLAGVWLMPSPVRAADQPQVSVPQLSPERLDILDRKGYFTPAFKKAVHDLVDAKQAVVNANKDDLILKAKLPALQKQVVEADDKTTALQKQLDDLNKIDETDFAELQKKMNDASTTSQEQRELAQAYVWAYPTSPHQVDAQHFLEAVQKKIADDAKAAADAEAAKAAAHAKLVQRAQAHDLSLPEWRDFLLNMTQEEVLKFMGPPQVATQEYWTYSTGGFTVDPSTNQRVGLQVNFNAGRVINVSEAP